MPRVILWILAIYGTLSLAMATASSQQAVEHNIAGGGRRMLCGILNMAWPSKSDVGTQPASDVRGPGATGGLSADKYAFLPQDYRGRIVSTASGAVVPHTPLVCPYPTYGMAYSLPLHAAAKTRHNATRPYKHTYPNGYTLLFISYHSSAYTGFHWAVYNQNGVFYGYDDDDITSGDYDYDESDELPAGCEHADAQLARIYGADSRLDGSQAQVHMICMPVPARRADTDRKLLNSAAVQLSRDCPDLLLNVTLLASMTTCSSMITFVLGYLLAAANERRFRNVWATIVTMAAIACFNRGVVRGILAGFWRVY